VSKHDTPAARLDVDAILSGDRKAFEELVVQESPRLYRIILRIVGDADEAQNVLQETFLQAYKSLGAFRREAKLTTWIYSIGINLSRAALKRSRRFTPLGERDLDQLQPQFRWGMYRDTPESWNPHVLAERKEVQVLVRDAINRLPEDYREVVTLRDMEQLSTTEVAQTLGITEGAVRVRLHRARQALKGLLDSKLAHE
jgi:RNA polymerase sigma-70 factor (ECF subfamily)